MAKVFYIDLKDVRTKEGFHDALERQLSLPDYYGRNLDALYDVLTESDEDRILIIYNCMSFEEANPQYVSRIKKMLTRAMEECPDLKIKLFN